MIKESVRCLFYLCVFSLNACVVSTAQTVNSDIESPGLSSPDLVAQTEQEDLDPNLPDVELDQATLEQLLIHNFASYNQDWATASESALLAAQSSRDYRLARAAAILALRVGDYTAAEQSAKLWRELNANSVDSIKILIIAQVGANQVDDALVTIGELRDGKLLDDHIKEVAGLMVKHRNEAGALRVMTEFIDTNSESAQVRLSGAFVAEVFKKYEQAQAWLDSAMSLRPNWDLAAQMKVDILQNRGQFEERSAFVEQYAKQHPESVRMNIHYAADLARQERYDAALTLMESVIKGAPDNSAAFNYAGALAQQLNDIDKAKKYYQKALRLNPDDDNARWSLGLIAASDKKHITSERYFDGISSKELFVAAQIQVANARYHIKGLRRALDTLAGLEPATQGEYVDVALARHNLLLRDYQYEEAFSYINEVLLYLPDDLDLLYSRALVAAELRKTDVAEADFRAILAQQPESADTLNALGYTLADQTERYAEAKELIAKALVYKPDSAHILDSMGWVLYRLNDYNGAIDFLQKAYDLHKGAEVAAHLGEVLWVSGEEQKAKLIWREGLDEGSDNPVLNATLKRFNVELQAK